MAKNFAYKSFFKSIQLIGILYGFRVLVGSIYLYFVSPVDFDSNSNENSYHIKFSYLKENSALKLDSTNVTVVDYSKIKSLGVENIKSYNPISIGLMGLRYNQEYNQDSCETIKKIILAHANWLIENQSEDGSWKINHDKKIDTRILQKPWSSALAQGFGMSLLSRAYVINPDSNYLFALKKAINPFRKNIKDKGVTCLTSFGPFYEEYPLKNPDHVLNGFIYSLFGLYDTYQTTGDSLALNLFHQGVTSLKNALPNYDSGSWSLYSLNENPQPRNHWNYSSPFYQKIHVAQLNGLYLITGDIFFKNYAIKFGKQSNNSHINLIIYPSYVLYTDFVWIYRKLI